MNKLLYFISLVLLFSCTNSTNTDTKSSAKIEINNTEITSKDSEPTSLNDETLEFDEFVEDDCIFDQTTQTDDFLIGIKEFENYTWDSITKTATIILDNLDTIFVSRGGCSHFGVSAELIIHNDNVDYSDWNNVNQKILWISNILSSEFAHEDIKNEMDSSKQIIDNDYGYFTTEYLQDNNYEFTRFIEKNRVTITLSYYIN